MDDRTNGAKLALQNMLFYYLSSLIDIGAENPKSIIASDIGAMIDLSEEQIQYINAHINTKGTIVDNLDSCIQLLNNMSKERKIDWDSIKIISEILALMKEKYTATIKDYDFNDIFNLNNDEQ